METNRTQTAPVCIGIIMDGNRRWAKERGVSVAEGHRAGYTKFKEALSWVKNEGIQSVIVYAFSTENWNRSDVEVTALVDLLRSVLSMEAKDIAREDVRIVFVGDLARFPEDVQKKMYEVMNQTMHNAPYTLAIASSYGGRAEIMHAVKALLNKKEARVTESDFEKELWTHELPDPDLIIRSGGEKRLSNFLPWQSVYSELFFTDTLWPDFSEREFKEIIRAFQMRERRHGT
jgi:undecaprenyl diphosphate synthase